MQRLISNAQLTALTEEYHLVDDTEIPLLIRLLWSIRHFQEDLLSLPLNRLQLLIIQVCEIDHSISKQILQLYSERASK